MVLPTFVSTFVVALTTIGLVANAAEESPSFFKNQPEGVVLGGFVEAGFSFVKKPGKRILRSSPQTANRDLFGHTVVVGLFTVTCASDYTTIADALAAEGPNASLELCDGEFNEVVELAPSSHVTIKGQGIGDSIIKPDSGLFVINAGMGGVTLKLEDLTLDGVNLAAGVGTDEALAGVVCEFSCDAEIQNVEVKNIANTENGRSFDIFASTTTNANDGNHIKVEDSEFPNVAAVGIFVNGPGTEGEIEDNTLMALDPAVNSLVIGIQVSRQADADVERNYLNGFSVTGSAMVSTAINVFCSGEDTEVKRNSVEASDIAVNLLGSSSIKVERNDFYSGEVGVLLEYNPTLVMSATECTSIDVEDNRVFRNEIEGFDFGVKFSSGDTPANTVMEDNRVRRNDIHGCGNGICVESGDENDFDRNDIEGSTLNGIVIRGGSHNGFRRNDIEESGVNGIEVSGGSENYFDRNDIEESGTNGILLFDDGTNPVPSMNDFERNRIEDSGDYGIRVDAGDDNVFRKNRIRDSGIAGIGNFGGTGNQFIDNDID